MTLLGTVIAVEVPILSAATLAACGWFARRTVAKMDKAAEAREAEFDRVTATLGKHDDALGLLIAQVLPTNAPSLTERLHEIQTRQAVQEERQVSILRVLDPKASGLTHGPSGT